MGIQDPIYLPPEKSVWRLRSKELDMEQQTGSKLAKEYVKAVYCHPAYLFNLYAEYIMWNEVHFISGWMKHKLESRLPGEISITSGMQMDLEKDMAIHSSNLPGKPPWTEEPGSLQSIGSQRVRHDWATNHSSVQHMQMTPPLWQKAKRN